MIKNESCLDLFQRFKAKDDNLQSTIIHRLEKSIGRFFPNGFNDERGELIEYFDENRIKAKINLHRFIDDYLEYLEVRRKSWNLRATTNEPMVQSPRANKTFLQPKKENSDRKIQLDRPLKILYIDTEFKECPFNSDRVDW